MELLKFEDTCIIKRYGIPPNPEPEPEPTPSPESEPSEDDDWDEEEGQTVYEGECMYQEAWTGFSYPVIEHSSVVFLPSNDTLIEVNDEILITTRKGRVRKAYAESVKDVKLPLHGKEVTRITLKQNI